MGRPSNTAVRRAQIVRGLEQVMAANGYERASVAAVAEAAGLAAGLIHYHFESKQEILVELVRDLGQRLAQRRDEATRRAGSDPRRRLEAWLDAHVALGRGADPQAVVCWITIGAESLRQPEVRAIYTQALEQERDELEALIGAAVASLRGPAPSAQANAVARPTRRTSPRVKAMAAGLLAAIQGAYLLGTAAPGVAPRGFARAALRAMLDGMLASAASASTG